MIPLTMLNTGNRSQQSQFGRQISAVVTQQQSQSNGYQTQQQQSQKPLIAKRQNQQYRHHQQKQQLIKQNILYILILCGIVFVCYYTTSIYVTHKILHETSLVSTSAGTKQYDNAALQRRHLNDQAIHNGKQNHKLFDNNPIESTAATSSASACNLWWQGKNSLGSTNINSSSSSSAASSAAAAHQVIKTDKDGNVVVKSFTSITANDLHGVTFDRRTTGSDDVRAGREVLLEMLDDAGVKNIDNDVIGSLPLWEEITDMYYHNYDSYATTSIDHHHHNSQYRDIEHSEKTSQQQSSDQQSNPPIIYGLETCQQFRETIPGTDASIGVAGLFNTGTNPLAMYLAANCQMPNNTNSKNKGIRWQVPWGKHMLANRKWMNTASHDSNVNKTTILPIILVRDPYSWMQSMCKHPYAAKWKHSGKHCPNLVSLNEKTQQEMSVGVNIAFPGDVSQPVTHWESLVHLWSDWYNQYIHATYPRIIVRFEDLIYQPKQIVASICQCAGAIPIDSEQFQYVVDSGKWGNAHKESSNMITAMIKYGNPHHRSNTMTQSDIQFARNFIDNDLLRLFRYKPVNVQEMTTSDSNDKDKYVNSESYLQQMGVQSIE